MRPLDDMIIPLKIIDDLENAYEVSGRKHGPLNGDMACLGALTEEYHEVIDAIRRGEAWKVRAELLDVANVCIRRIATIDEEDDHEIA